MEDGSTLDKEAASLDLLQTEKHGDKQLDMMAWKMDSMDKDLAVQVGVQVDSQDAAVISLIKSVTEVRHDYQALRRELVEVQALQRELSGRLRAQLRSVHGKFANLRQRLAQVPPPR